MPKPKRTTVTMNPKAYGKVALLARRRNRKVPSMIAELAAQAAEQQLAAARRVRALREGAAKVFGGLSAKEIDAICNSFRNLDS